jgi:hypothetical protein
MEPTRLGATLKGHGYGDARAGAILILSRREAPFVGWVSIDEFENLFAFLADATIAVPASRQIRGLPQNLAMRAFGRFVPLPNLPSEGDLLLVVAHTPSDLQMLQSVPNAKKRFRNVAAYVIDSYYTEDFGAATEWYDHVFCTTLEGVRMVEERFGVSSSLLRQGFDCLNWASVNPDRGTDLIGFGRQPESFHRSFQKAFHHSQSLLMYLHSPIGTTVGPDVWTERPMILKLLQKSKISLAFNLSIEPLGSRPRAENFLTNRWLESLGCGCVVVGKRPPGQMAQEMLCWPEATIELPDDAREAPAIIMALASDTTFLHTTRLRNVIEMCRRHDWRYRIRDIYNRFDLELPPALRSELAMLKDLPEKLELMAHNDF